MKKARQRGRRGRGMPDIGLSEEQKAKIEAIRKDARAASKDKKGEERKAIYQKMQKDINALLTDEQREKLKKARQGGPRGRGRRGRGGDRRPRKKAADK
jgi:hypothetical protein